MARDWRELCGFITNLKNFNILNSSENQFEFYKYWRACKENLSVGPQDTIINNLQVWSSPPPPFLRVKKEVFSKNKKVVRSPVPWILVLRLQSSFLLREYNIEQQANSNSLSLVHSVFLSSHLGLG